MQAYPVDMMMYRYAFYRQKYMIMGDNFVNWPKGKLGDRQMWEHLNGNISLCVLAGPASTLFLTFDIDLQDPEVVRKVMDVLVDLGVPREKIYVSTSGGKGYHVDLFFAGPMYNWKAKQLYDLVIYFGGLNPAKVEYRPTAGQSIKVPLGIHRKTGNRCWFLDRDTLEPIEDFDYINRTETIDVDIIEEAIKVGNRRRFDQMLADVLAEEPPEQKRTSTVAKRMGNKTPASFDITEPGTRQKKMIELALYLYRHGGDFNSIYSDLEKWLMRQEPSMINDSFGECMRNARNIASWVMRKGKRQELGEDKTHDYHKNTRIFETDVKRIVQGKTKSARLLAFLITVFCDKYDFCGMGGDKLSEMTGIKSRMTIATAEKDLVDRKLFWKQAGGMKFAKSKLRKVTNKYRFPMDYDRGGEFIEIDGLVTAENIYELYIRTLAALLEEGDAKASLTAKEFKDWRMMRDAMAEGCDSDGGGEAGAEGVSAQSGD